MLPQRFLRLKEVISRTGLSRSAIYSLMNQNSFPKSVLLAQRSVGWLESDIEAWVNVKVQQGLQHV